MLWIEGIRANKERMAQFKKDVSEDLDRVIQSMAGTDKAVLRTMVARTGMKESAAEEAIRKETVYAAAEAVELGIATGLYTPEKRAAEEEVATMADETKPLLRHSGRRLALRGEL